MDFSTGMRKELDSALKITTRHVLCSLKIAEIWDRWQPDVQYGNGVGVSVLNFLNFQYNLQRIEVPAQRNDFQYFHRHNLIFMLDRIL